MTRAWLNNRNLVEAAGVELLGGFSNLLNLRNLLNYKHNAKSALGVEMAITRGRPYTEPYTDHHCVACRFPCEEKDFRTNQAVPQGTLLSYVQSLQSQCTWREFDESEPRHTENLRADLAVQASVFWLQTRLARHEVVPSLHRLDADQEVDQHVGISKNYCQLCRSSLTLFRNSSPSFFENDPPRDSRVLRRFSLSTSPCKKLSIASASTTENLFSPRRDANASKAVRCSGFISIVVRISRSYMHMHVAHLRHTQSLRADLVAPARVSAPRVWLLKHVERPRTDLEIRVVDRRVVRPEITF